MNLSYSLLLAISDKISSSEKLSLLIILLNILLSEEFFNISAGESFDLNNVETITDSVSDLLEDPTIKSNVDKERIKLDVIYDSVIVAKTLSNELNKYLTDDLLSPDIKYSKYPKLREKINK